jgi:uncharacterized protein (TIGR01244 family)
MFVPACRSSVLLVLLLTAPLQASTDDAALTGAPIERFHRVDERLYRGAQPDAAGFRYLRDLGIRTVINLREEADAARLDEQRMVESLGMRYVHLPVADGNFFTRSRTIPEETVGQFFGALDADRGPVFVHCRRGADRTGAIVSFYRIARNQWDGGRAYAEARTLGMRSWYQGLKRQIEQFGERSAQYAAAQ